MCKNLIKCGGTWGCPQVPPTPGLNLDRAASPVLPSGLGETTGIASCKYEQTLCSLRGMGVEVKQRIQPYANTIIGARR